MQNKDLNLASPVGILGFGVEGQSTLRYLQSKGVEQIVVLDAKPVAKEFEAENVQIFSGENYLDGLKDCATVVRSAGVNPLMQELLRFQMNGGLVTSQVQIFMEQTRSKKVVGVTGTLGKGTCITMLEGILKSQNINCIIGGNYGVAALDLLATETEDRITLLELSSFQLMTLSISPSIAIVLRTTSEHLDWHRSVEEYRDAKANIVRYQGANDTVVYFADAEGSLEIAKQGRGRKLAVGAGERCMVRLEENSLHVQNDVLSLENCIVQGKHQLENMGTALLASWVLGVPVQAGIAALQQYAGLTYRLENKGEIKGVQYWNDSYATRPEAALAAAASMKHPFALILGGSEKNADFTELALGLAKLPLLKGIAFIGQTAERLNQACNAVNCEKVLKNTLEDAFAWSTQLSLQLAKKDGKAAVLMSPACASFGLFANYKERGKRFDELFKATKESSLT